MREKNDIAVAVPGGPCNFFTIGGVNAALQDSNCLTFAHELIKSAIEEPLVGWHGTPSGLAGTPSRGTIFRDFSNDSIGIRGAMGSGHELRLQAAR